MHSSPELNHSNIFTHISVQKNVTDKNGQYFEAVGKLNGKEVRIYCKTSEKLDPSKIEEILGNAFVSKITKGKENRNTAELKSNKLKINVLFSDPETYKELKEIKDKKVSLNQQLKKDHPLNSIKKSVGDAYAKVYNAVQDFKNQVKPNQSVLSHEEKFPEGENFGELASSAIARTQDRRHIDRQLNLLNTFFDPKSSRNYKNAALDVDAKSGDFILVSRKVDKERDRRVAAALINFIDHKVNEDYHTYQDLKDQGMEFAPARERLVANHFVLKALAGNTNQPYFPIVSRDPEMSEKLRQADTLILLNM